MQGNKVMEVSRSFEGTRVDVIWVPVGNVGGNGSGSETGNQGSNDIIELDTTIATKRVELN